MRAIVISKAAFEAAFDKARDALELETLRARQAGPIQLDEMHRKFVFELCTLRDRLEAAP
jgi:hypothetical protein